VFVQTYTQQGQRKFFFLPFVFFEMYSSFHVLRLVMISNTTLCAELKTALKDTTHDSMRLVGITGGIGTGKSTVADILVSLGYIVMSSDDIAKEIMERDDVRDELQSAFGNQIFHGNGTYNRPVLAEMIFGHHAQAENNLHLINAITHPKVIRELYRRALEYHRQGHTLIFNESALLFETGLYRCYDVILMVTATMPIRYERLRLRGMHDTEIAQRMAKQLSEEQKQAYNPICAENNSTREALHNKVLEALAIIQ
jgi:dephospho-CoA kinase